MSQRAAPALAWRLRASLALVPPLLTLAACEGRSASQWSKALPTALSTMRAASVVIRRLLF